MSGLPNCRDFSRRPSWPTSATRSPTAAGRTMPRPRPLALFDGLRTDFSLARLAHYTGTPAEHVQHYILFTNYHRYVDEFVSRGLRAPKAGALHGAVGGRHVYVTGRVDDPEARARRGRWRRHQMPAYHLMAEDARGHHPGEHRRRAVQRQDHLRPPGGAAAPGLADDRPLRRACGRARPSATTSWPTPICATTTCWTTCCRRRSRSRRSPRCRWR